MPQKTVPRFLHCTVRHVKRDVVTYAFVSVPNFSAHVSAKNWQNLMRSG